MDFIKYQFNEDDWTIYLTDADDTVLLGENTVAEVQFDKKEIYFNKEELTLDVVLHELWHLHFAYCYTSDAGLDYHQLEEVSSSLFADKGEKIIAKGKDILKQLKKLKDSNKGGV
jgi:hypothetical protein